MVGLMKGYVVCTYKSISDEKILKKYAQQAIPAIQKYNGKILIRGGNNLNYEGENLPRTVVIEFPNIEDAKNFYHSSEYQEAINAAGDTIKRSYQIVEGI